MKMKSRKGKPTLPAWSRTDGITSFTEEFAPHPGRKMWQEYIQAYSKLPELERAEHKLANSETYVNYCDAMKYGVQIYNIRTNGGRNGFDTRPHDA